MPESKVLHELVSIIRERAREVERWLEEARGERAYHNERIADLDLSIAAAESDLKRMERAFDDLDDRNETAGVDDKRGLIGYIPVEGVGGPSVAASASAAVESLRHAAAEAKADLAAREGLRSPTQIARDAEEARARAADLEERARIRHEGR